MMLGELLNVNIYYVSVPEHRELLNAPLEARAVSIKKDNRKDVYLMITTMKRAKNMSYTHVDLLVPAAFPSYHGMNQVGLTVSPVPLVPISFHRNNVHFLMVI